MIVEYEKEYLEELYNNGKCTNKKYRFQKPVIAKYQKRIDTLMAATRMYRGSVCFQFSQL